MVFVCLKNHLNPYRFPDSAASRAKGGEGTRGESPYATRTKQRVRKENEA